MNRLIQLALGLMLAATASSMAEPSPATQPLPKIVQKYVAALKSLPDVDIDAIQTQPAAPLDSAHLTLQEPNKMRLTSTSSDVTTVVSDGTTLEQWDAKQVFRQAAPGSFDKINVVLGVGAAADITMALLTDPSTITDYSDLKDVGPDPVDGEPAEKVTSIEDGDTATFWLSPDTGLPLQANFTGGRRDRTITLHYNTVGALPAAMFTAEPPAGLADYVPTPDVPLLPVGISAPAFTLHRAGASGMLPQTVGLSNLRGQVVVMDFWASWCRPCKKTMPHIQALHRQVGRRAVFLSINTWDQQPRMAAFIKAHPQYTTTMLCDPSASAQSVAVSKYRVSGIPTVYIIDRLGKVAGAFVGDDPDAARNIEATLVKLGVE